MSDDFNNTQQTFVTPEGKEKLETELAYLKTEKRPGIAKRIESAKELGDLSENAEYAAAKDDQAFNEARIFEIENILKRAEIATPTTNTDTVGIGSTVTIDDQGVSKTYRLVGFNEANLSEGKISNVSPLGQALMGKKMGDKISFTTPKGMKELTIISIQ